MSRYDAWKSQKLKSTVVARVLLKQWTKSDGEKQTLETLAARLGELRRGENLVWWERHPRFVERTAAYLEVSVPELVGRRSFGRDTIAFPEFPLLPALRSDETSYPLHHDAAGRPRSLMQMVAAAIEPQQRPCWIMAGAGTGKSLVVRTLRARGRAEVIAESVATLTDAASLAGTALPLVVELDVASPGADAEALARLGDRRVGTVILAPFEYPDLPDVWTAPGLDESGSGSGWEILRARLRGDWRDRLVEWVVERLSQSERTSRLTKKAVSEWLARFDPSGQIVATPGDLLALCADFDVHGDGAADLPTRAQRWLHARSRDAFAADAPSTWLTYGAADTYEAVVRRHLRDANHAYGTLSAQHWSDLVPHEQLAGGGEAPGQAMIVAHLRHAALLRGGPMGLVPYPRWVEHAIASRDIANGFESRAFDWGLLAADPSRRPLFDAVVDALADERFLVLVRSIAKAGAPQSLAALGVVEFVVAALGRRLADRKVRLADRDVSAIHTVVSFQLDALVRDEIYPEARHPFTRRSCEEWFATGWAISIGTPKPPGCDASGHAWELPGWSPPDLQNVSKHRFPWSYDGRRASPEVRRLIRLAPVVVEQITTDDVPDDVPRVLLPALFVAAGSRGWSLRYAHLKALSGSFEEQYLAATAVQLGDQERPVLADMMWDLAARGVADGARVPVAERIASLRGGYPYLARFVVENVDCGVIERTARRDGIHRRATAPRSFLRSDPLQLMVLTREVRHRVLRAFFEARVERDTHFDEVQELLPLFGDAEIELALDLIRAADRATAGTLTRLVWTRAPRRARDEARHAIEAGLPSAEGWFATAPRVELPFLVELIDGKHLKPWVMRWAYERALTGGRVAERLFRLARASETSAP